MANADQIKNLIKSHYSHDENRFDTLVKQLAAYEARKGNTNLAKDLKNIADESRKVESNIIQFSKSNELIDFREVNIRLSDMVLSEELSNKLEKIINENKNSSKLRKHGLNPNQTILLAGNPGTGKTMTASVLAKALDKPLGIIYTDKLTTKYMGETTAKLRRVFDTIENMNAVYLFDEFDAIGGERYRDNDVGEIRRVLNTFLQLVENVHSQSLILAATNSVASLDKALYRRFDEILFYNKPSKNEIIELMAKRLNNFYPEKSYDAFVKIAEGLSHSEISTACDNLIKECIINDLDYVTKEMIIQALNDRQSVYREVGTK